MEGFLESEVPGLEGRQVREGSATAAFAGAAKHWHTEALKWQDKARVRRLRWFVVGGLSVLAAEAFLFLVMR